MPELSGERVNPAPAVALALELSPTIARRKAPVGKETDEEVEGDAFEPLLS